MWHIRSRSGRRRPRMPISSVVSRLRDPLTSVLALAAVFVAAGGYVHLREWLDVYRHYPADLSGVEVVRVGFVINAGASAVLAIALLAAAFLGRRAVLGIVAAAALFQAASLAALIQSRRGTVLGWMEVGWSRGAAQTRAVEIGALLVLAAAATLAVSVRGIHVGRVRVAPAVVRAS